MVRDCRARARNKMEKMRILILSPHTDDAEFACGGSISKWLSLGMEVFCLTFSAAKQSLREFNLPENTLEIEAHKATEALGISPKNLQILDYPVRRFSDYRQDILDDMLKHKALINPELVLMPSRLDTHQDHQVINAEGFRAFKNVSLLGYEMPQNNLSFPTDLFVKLSRKNIDDKMRALDCYKSQRKRPYIDPEFIKGLALVRGTQIGHGAAEAFEVMRWIQ